MTTSFAANTVLVDVFSDTQETFTVGSGGTLNVSVPLLSGRILVPQN